MATETAEAIRWSEGKERRPLWRVRWEEAHVEVDAQGRLGGRMREVTGALFENAKEVSAFKADAGEADKETGDLGLTGRVTVTSKEHGAVLRCDELRYASKTRDVVRAIGRVSVEGKWGRVGELPEIWATPDLKRFGTPDMFQRR